jgi:competence protein ComEC
MSKISFYVFVAGFTFGIFLSSFWKFGFSFFLLLALLSLIIFIWNKYFTQNNKIIFFIGLTLFSFGLGILRYEIKEVRGKDALKKLVGEKVSLQGIIIDEPSIKDQSVNLKININVINSPSTDQFNLKEKNKILVSTSLFPTFNYGDLVKVEGKIKQVENFQTDTGRDFDYIGFLAKDDIFYSISFAQVEKISSHNGSVLKNILFKFKNYFLTKINSLIKEPESALLGGLILGAKNSLGQELQDNFRRAGVSHIVALSGYNVTIIAFGIMTVLSFLPRLFSLSFGVIGIFLFALMTGGGATVVRASIMSVLVLLSKSTHRKYDMKHALILAGFFMLIHNPKILVFDISFQLSFLATLALIFICPIIETKLTFITERFKIRELVVATVATQIFVLPFIIYKMGLVSVYALFTNLFVLPVIPIIMFLGFVVFFLALVSPLIAWPVALLCSLLLSYMLIIINIFSHLPFSSFTINFFPKTFMIISYIMIILGLFFIQKNKINHENN